MRRLASFRVRIVRELQTAFVAMARLQFVDHVVHPCTPAQASKTPHTTAINQSNGVDFTSPSAKRVQHSIAKERDHHKRRETRTKHRAPHSQQHIRAEEVRMRDRLTVDSGERAVQAAGESG
jgi:hypothetical protein